MLRLLVAALWLASVLDGAPASAAVTVTVTAPTTGQSIYVVNGVDNGPLTLTRGETYVFQVNALNHPFWITTVRDSATAVHNAYSDGVTNNGADVGTVTFVVPQDAPPTLYYQCEYHDPMGGTLTIGSPPGPARVPALGPRWLAAIAALVAGVAFLALRIPRARKRDRPVADRGQRTHSAEQLPEQ